MRRLEQNIVLVAFIHVVTAFQDNISLPGDVVLAGLHEVTTYEDGSCGRVIPQSIQTHEAVRWFFKRLNDRDYIPGVKLGYHAFQTCGQPARATHQTFNILDTYNGDRKPLLVGVLGPHRSSETQPVSRLLSSHPHIGRLPQISYSATAASLSDRSVYKNLFRVIETDDTQVKVIVQLMQSLNWNYIGIVYENETYGRDGAEALRGLAEDADICVPVFVGISPDASTIERRQTFSTIVNQLEIKVGSPVLGVVFFGQGSTAQVMFENIDKLKLEHFQLIVCESSALDSVYVRDPVSKVGVGPDSKAERADQIYSRAKGLLTPSPPYHNVELFRQHWMELHTNGTLMYQQIQDNDWLAQYMEEITECSFAGSTSIEDSCVQQTADYIHLNSNLSMYSYYAILGAAIFAKAFKDVHHEKCNSAGICSELKGLPWGTFLSTIENIRVSLSAEFDHELQNYNLSFRFQNGHITYDGAEGLSTYDVFNLQSCVNPFCFTKVASYINSHLLVVKTAIKSSKKGALTSGSVSAQCQPTFRCDLCTDSGRYGKILFLPGDFYIVGLVPIHNRKPNSLQCGELRQSTLSVDIAEAMRYALDSLNGRNGVSERIDGNVTIGLVLIDTCAHSFVTQERVIEFNNGALKLNKHVHSYKILDRVIGYVGPAYSSVSVPFASVMNEIRKLYISYSATSSSLSEREKFPYFMRTSSPDYKQANVIMEVAELMNSKYVQIIYSDEEYGKAGRDVLVTAAKKRNICIAQTLSVPDTTENREFQGYVSDIRKYPHARVLILFLLPHMFKGFLSVLSTMNFGEFVFIGGEGWAQRGDLLLPDTSANLRGSLTITQKLPRDTTFEDYYRSINIHNTSNPWLQDYIQNNAECYYHKSFDKHYSRECTSTDTVKHRQVDAWVPFTINAVYALVLGFHTAVDSICGGIVFCREYSTQKLIDNVRSVRLDMYRNKQSIRIFDDNGEGSVGYTISQVVRIGQNLDYKEVGLSSETGIKLTVPVQDINMEIDFSSTCQNEFECSRCREQSADPSTKSENPVVSTATVSLAVVSGVFFVVLVVLAVCLVKNKTPNTPTEDTYLTVIPDENVSRNQSSSELSGMNPVTSDIESDFTYTQAVPIDDRESNLT